MIAQTFYRRGLIEVWGRGTLKIARLMQEAGLAPPDVAVRTGTVVVTFGLPTERPTRPGQAAPSKATGETTGETPGETPGKTPAAILELLKREPYLSIPDLATRLGRSESAIERAIRRLRESGRLRRIGAAKGGHWEVIE